MKKQKLTTLQLKKEVISNIQGGVNKSRSNVQGCMTFTCVNLCQTARTPECPLPNPGPSLPPIPLPS